MELGFDPGTLGSKNLCLDCSILFSRPWIFKEQVSHSVILCFLSLAFITVLAE